MAIIWPLALSLGFALGHPQSTKHPFDLSDWIAISEATPRAISGDGNWILFTVAQGAEKGVGTVEWRLSHYDGSEAHKVEMPNGFNPVGFMPDGQLFGPLRADGAAKIAIFSVSELKKDAKPTVAITIPGDIRTMAMSPDGKRFAALADPVEKDPLDGVHTVIKADKSSLYVVGSDGTGGKWWSPELQDVTDFAWSPDSASVALMSAVSKIGHYFMKSWIDLASEAGTKHVTSVNNAVAGLAWTNRGKQIAFTSTTTSVLTPDHLYMVDSVGGKAVDVTPKIAGSVMGVKAAPDGTLLVSVNHGVHNEIDRFSNGKLETAYKWPNGFISGPPIVGSGGQLLFAVGDSSHAQNLAVPSGGTSLKRITEESDALLDKVQFGKVEVVHWTSKEGIALEGIVTFPPDFVPGKPRAFVVFPHGGPEANDLLYFTGDARFMAALGYVVLQPQYRGSTGYGTEFLDSIYQHFGDRAYRDVDSATDFAIAQGWADPNRLAMFGWSAGGFMTSWSVTQTHRYKAAIEGAGITDWGSFMWTSDLQQFDYDGRWPDKNPGAFQKFSAVMFADRVTTPLLILHGAADMRVPTYQGREYFETLLAKGKTTRMVTYPGSNHFPSLWEQRLDIYRELAAWLKKYDP